MFLVSNDTTYPIYTNFLNFNTATSSFQPNPQIVYNLPFGPAVAMFLLISAVAHFYLATIGYARYDELLKKGMNPIRFYEYALSSSLMIVLIGMLAGVWDLGAVIFIFGLNATMNFFGLMMELHNQTTEKTDWTAYIFGCFAGFIPWVVLGIYFFGALLPDAGKVPTFLYFIFFSLAIFFNIFAVNMALQYRAKGRWKDYLFGERVYVILSLVAKSALAWQVFAGTLRGA